MDESREPDLVGVEVLPKLLILAEHLDELRTEDRQLIVQMLKFCEEGKAMPRFDIPRIVSMQVPGEAIPVPTLLQDEMVSAESKYLTEVIWQYMPLEKFFALLSTNKLHFSTLASMPDKGEGTLPQHARELSKAQLPAHLREGTAGVSADDVLDHLECHRKHTVSISCWYMNETDSLAMWRDYAPNNGVAIQTTVKRLFSSLRKINETNIHIGRVIYYRPDEEDRYAMQMYFGSLYVKHSEPFRKEKEIRAIAPSSIYKYGIDIPVSLPELLERLVLSPDLKEWAVPSFTESMHKLGVECPIEKSRAT